MSPKRGRKVAELISAERTGSAGIIIPVEVKNAVENSVGHLIRTYAKGDPAATVRDILNARVRNRALARLKRYTTISGKRILDVGSGFGLMLTTFAVNGADAFGIEPDADGFQSSLKSSRTLLAANGVEPWRATAGCGERLPFKDATFDVLYSSNALEHVEDPEKVLREALRVLRPGGILHFEIPNFLSYWEGHYLVPTPPIFSRSMLAWWVKTVFRRDPAFANTINTLNPIWCRKQIRNLGSEFNVRMLTLGQDLFLERLAAPFEFDGELQGPLAPIIRGIQSVNFGNWIGRLIVAAQGFYPMFLTLEKM
jgi:ubiquinone/menaquinone biosynthesis C-methylase UbiE